MNEKLVETIRSMLHLEDSGVGEHGTRLYRGVTFFDPEAAGGILEEDFIGGDFSEHRDMRHGDSLRVWASPGDRMVFTYRAGSRALRDTALKVCDTDEEFRAALERARALAGTGLAAGEGPGPLDIAEAFYDNPPHDPIKAECIVALAARAVAAFLLRDRGLVFRRASESREAAEILAEMRKAEINDLPGVAALYMQVVEHLADESSAREISKDLCGLGDHHWYDQHQHEKYDRQVYALNCYQLAAGLDPENKEAYWEAISVCWQGSPTRFKVALPYGVVLARLDPKRNEVAQILARISG